MAIKTTVEVAIGASSVLPVISESSRSEAQRIGLNIRNLSIGAVTTGRNPAGACSWIGTHC